jgi:hypothetical protein
VLKWLRKAFGGDTRTVNEVVEAYGALLEKYSVGASPIDGKLIGGDVIWMSTLRS